MNAHRILGANDREQVRQAIARAEAGTRSEMVCALATESGHYDRADSVFGLFVAIVFLIGVQWLHDSALVTSGQWGGEGLHVAWQALSVVVGFVLGSLLCQHVHPLRRLLVSERQMGRNAERAAAHVFMLADVAGTRERVGLLIYVSLFEHRIVILADERAREALGDEGIAKLRDVAVADLRQGQVARALIDVIEQAAVPLAKALPDERTLTEREIDDHLIVFHPRPLEANRRGGSR